MIRKHIYITRAHQEMLERLAKARGISEAEVIRQAIEHEATGRYAQASVANAYDAEALEEFIQSALGRRAHSTGGDPYQWNRNDAYADRLDRFGPENSND
jgi:hypothetical protein